MRRIEFTWNEGWNDTKTEIFEFEDNITDDEIQEEYDMWIGELIGDRMGWGDVEE